jgi:hypothetical protein
MGIRVVYRLLDHLVGGRHDGCDLAVSDTITPVRTASPMPPSIDEYKSSHPARSSLKLSI